MHICLFTEQNKGHTVVYINDALLGSSSDDLLKLIFSRASFSSWNLSSSVQNDPHQLTGMEFPENFKIFEFQMKIWDWFVIIFKTRISLACFSFLGPFTFFNYRYRITCFVSPVWVYKYLHVTSNGNFGQSDVRKLRRLAGEIIKIASWVVLVRFWLDRLMARRRTARNLICQAKISQRKFQKALRQLKQWLFARERFNLLYFSLIS